MKKMFFAFLFLLVIIALLIATKDPRFSKYLTLQTLMAPKQSQSGLSPTVTIAPTGTLKHY